MIDKRVNCADGCFIKVANKNPERIAKKLAEDPKMIRLFRGESFKLRSMDGMKAIAKAIDQPLEKVKKIINGIV